jgi:predicted ArsR family transcriptional regulator
MKNLDNRDHELVELINQIRSTRSDLSKLNELLKRYEKEFGSEADARVLEIIAETTRKQWSEIAASRENNDIDGILYTLWKSFERAGGVFTVERTENSAQIHCTKCPVADRYLKIGKPEYGLIFHCSTDPHIVAGFNPEMKFKITKRLMNGDDCCNHSYYLK